MNRRGATYGFAALVLGIVAILVVPLPPAVLDALLAFNLMGSGIVLLTSLSIGDPLEFSAFAPALLIATLFRLALDVSATRLILTQGHVEGGVGALIPAFGRLDRFRHPDHHPIHRDRGGFATRRRSCGALHARRDARQTNGNRR